jgi:hypothetical protein
MLISLNYFTGMLTKIVLKNIRFTISILMIYQK